MNTPSTESITVSIANMTSRQRSDVFGPFADFALALESRLDALDLENETLRTQFKAIAFHALHTTVSGLKPDNIESCLETLERWTHVHYQKCFASNLGLTYS